MVGFNHQVNGGEFEEALGDDEELGRLTCYSPLVIQRVGQDDKGWFYLNINMTIFGSEYIQLRKMAMRNNNRLQ